MPRRVELAHNIDFRAGLNLAADAFQLGESESPDLLNVDLDVRGGFGLRSTISPINLSTLSMTSAIHSMFRFATSSGSYEQILVGAGKYTYYGSGGNFTSCHTSTATAWTSTNAQRACAFKDALYIVNGVDAPRKWTGAAISALTQTYNDTISSPDQGDMPIAKCIAAHMGYVWVANTVESATNYRSRIRWSHPNQPEDWRTNDYIDIDVGHDGDEITALVPYGDRLLVFKKRSVHVITGYDPDTFQVFPLTQKSGAVSQEAVVATDHGVYWFDWPNGMFRWNGGGEPDWLYEPLYPTIRDGSIPAAYAAGATVGYLNRRVYLSVPWASSVENARTFVYDPNLGKYGGWTAWGIGFGPMLQWTPSSSAAKPLAVCAGGTRVCSIDGDGGTDVHYAAHLTLGGESGHYVSTPDSVDLSITGDLDVAVVVAADDYSPASAQTLASKWVTTDNQRSWLFQISSSGYLTYTWSANGSAAVATKTSSATLASVGITDGTQVWLRVFHDVNNGAVGNDVKFYYSFDGRAWAQLGSTQTTAGTTLIFDSTAEVVIGAWADSEWLAGDVYYADVYSGDRTAAGTEKGEFDATSLQDGATSYTDSYDNEWTIAGGTLSVESGQIDSYYFTRWYDAGSPSVIKRWRRPDIIIDADTEVTLSVSLYRDYDTSAVKSVFDIAHEFPDSGGVWGTSEWGLSEWTADPEGAQAILRGSSLGRARAVQLKFAGPSPSIRWAVNAVNLKYIPKKVR